jgi:hypothetical protein
VAKQPLTIKIKLVTKCHTRLRSWTDSLDQTHKLRKMRRSLTTISLILNTFIILGLHFVCVCVCACIYILRQISPIRELLKRGALKQACNRRRTSVYSSLLCNARNRRKSSHTSSTSLVATRHRSKHISAAVSRHTTIAAA